ncbi:hypothetical protein M406DRAFT_326487 [Cryphonectria parasitica EP155]|uniref:Uncharacterized protein n=1 Tax=Cryphonectria parasitica (strain ATCC 38755 / EP155) TaxID=660469 RepID=A0A9P4YE31_CRYP1|nr:uncharacterized protein M406DRAFT_326487 [Cryphonectria parasitica EP155]KAF3771087.1 hypothetical protein M406DRAFT_326487 [Cryphonectria parasitica EP155]
MDTDANRMTGPDKWEAIINEHIVLAKRCQTTSFHDAPEKLFPHASLEPPQVDTSTNTSPINLKLIDLHRDTVRAGRKAYGKFHAVIEGLKTERPKEDAWEDKIGSAAIIAKDKMVGILDKMVDGGKGVLRDISDESAQVENAKYLNFCVNGRKGGQQRVWTALETAGRNVDEAEAAALRWVAGRETTAIIPSSISTSPS